MVRIDTDRQSELCCRLHSSKSAIIIGDKRKGERDNHHITINWETKPDIESEQPEIYLVSLDQEEVKILDVLTEQYDAIYTKTDFKHFYIRFKTKEAFGKFKKYALELLRPYYVFEGDVERVVRVKREYHGIVELEPLDSFDITNTLAKILGLRNDY